jgi:hypothetical protein
MAGRTSPHVTKAAREDRQDLNERVVDRAVLARINEINRIKRLTGTLSLRNTAADKKRMAPRYSDPPAQIKAPAKAGTDARANLSIAADRQGDPTRIGESAQ